jgi:hypothetical protein
VDRSGNQRLRSQKVSGTKRSRPEIPIASSRLVSVNTPPLPTSKSRASCRLQACSAPRRNLARGGASAGAIPIRGGSRADRKLGSVSPSRRKTPIPRLWPPTPVGSRHLGSCKATSANQFLTDNRPVEPDVNAGQKWLSVRGRARQQTALLGPLPPRPLEQAQTCLGRHVGQAAGLDAPGNNSAGGPQIL